MKQKQLNLKKQQQKNVLDKYVNLDNKQRYQVDVNVCYDDSDYCSCLDDQWNYVVFALNKKEAERLALKEAQNRLNRDNDYHKYLEVVGCRKVELIIQVNIQDGNRKDDQICIKEQLEKYLIRD